MQDNNLKDTQLKSLILNGLKEIIDEKAAIIKTEIQLAVESRDSETKSNVGDKYETTREMMQLEIEKNMVQFELQMRIFRREIDPPLATSEWGWKYHHLGIPTKQKMPGERYLPQFGFYVSGFDQSPFGIEWMRFEDNCTMHKLVQTVPHLAFEVEDLDFELETRGLKIITKPNPSVEGIRVAMIECNGAPVELIEFKK